jgi:putative ABC transport system permease protein
VADITEQYILHYVYLSRDYYAGVYGKEPAGNMILADYADGTAGTADRVSAALIPLPGVTAVSRINDIRETYSKSMESVNYAVLIIIVSAAALAFVVLYNLTNINITERRRELATLKVLGFYDRELSAYVYRENILLTLFGIAIGMVMGKYLHQWLVRTVEIDMLMFGRAVHPMSYVLAALFTAVFSAAVNLAAHQKLKKIDMVESLKILE